MSFGGGRAGLVLVGTSLAAFTATLDNTVVAVALRDMQQDLGSGVTGLQGIITAYTVALAALLLAGGALVDVVGARRVLLAGVAGFGIASVGCATAGSVGTLVAWRSVQGGTAALLLPGSLAVLAAAYPDPVRRRRAVGIWAATGGLALVAGPVVGGVLVAGHGWPAVFWVNVPLCLVVTVLACVTPALPPSYRRRLDVRGTALTCLLLASATYAVVLAGRHGLTWQVGVALTVAACAGAVLLKVEQRHPDPLLPTALMRDRHFRGALVGAFAAALAVFVLLVFVSLHLELVEELDARAAGRVLLALPFALVLTAPLSGRWHAVSTPVTVGLGLAGAGLIGLGLALHEGTGTHVIQAWLALVGAGVGLTTAPLVSAVLTAATDARAGLAAASVNVARELGGVIAVAGLGSLAVAHLSNRLTSTLVAAGVAPHQRPELLDALLGARTSEARRLLVEDVGVTRALQVARGLQDAATTSFVSSTRLLLQCAGGLVLVTAVLSGWLLRPRPGRALSRPGQR